MGVSRAAADEIAVGAEMRVGGGFEEEDDASKCWALKDERDLEFDVVAGGGGGGLAVMLFHRSPGCIFMSKSSILTGETRKEERVELMEA